jgi:hypothetical protein
LVTAAAAIAPTQLDQSLECRPFPLRESNFDFSQLSKASKADVLDAMLVRATVDQRYRVALLDALATGPPENADRANELANLTTFARAVLALRAVGNRQ